MSVVGMRVHGRNRVLHRVRPNGAVHGWELRSVRGGLGVVALDRVSTGRISHGGVPIERRRDRRQALAGEVRGAAARVARSMPNVNRDSRGGVRSSSRQRTGSRRTSSQRTSS